MPNKDSLLPESPVEGLIPTLNKTGWMTEKLDRYSADFARFAGTIDAESLDIGCAYGVARIHSIADTTCPSATFTLKLKHLLAGTWMMTMPVPLNKAVRPLRK